MKPIGLKLDAIREFATFHGLTVDGDVFDRIQLCEFWQLNKDKSVMPPPADEPEETVN